MEEIFLDIFNNWISGLKTMVFLHNFIVSILLYMARQSNMSNVLKITFNLFGLLRELFTFGINMLPVDVSLSTCLGVTYSQFFANFCFKESLAIFLLWRLRQIEHRELDKWISLTLFFARTIAHLVLMALTRPFISDSNGTTVCFPNVNTTKIVTWTIISCDFLIEVYVTTRLVQILRRANRNAAQISSNIDRKTKRTLFTAVMYWNFLRLAVAFISNVLTSVYVEFVTQYSNTHIIVDSAIFGAVNIIMSYVITVDAEIVRVVEGKPKKGSDGSEKSVPGTPYTYQNKQSSLSSHTLPKYLSSMKQENDDITVSMKRLSFFEWANIVVGFRREKNNEKDFNEADIEDIIDGPSDATNNDLERGESKKDKS